MCMRSHRIGSISLCRPYVWWAWGNDLSTVHYPTFLLRKAEGSMHWDRDSEPELRGSCRFVNPGIIGSRPPRRQIWRPRVSCFLHAALQLCYLGSDPKAQGPARAATMPNGWVHVCKQTSATDYGFVGSRPPRRQVWRPRVYVMIISIIHLRAASSY